MHGEIGRGPVDPAPEACRGRFSLWALRFLPCAFATPLPSPPKRTVSQISARSVRLGMCFSGLTVWPQNVALPTRRRRSPRGEARQEAKMTTPETTLKSHAQVVVIGGGLIGCSILYHLTKLGWTDVVLLERSELTSGSTWHAAANIHGLHDSTNISRLQHYTMGLYKELEAETGQGCGIFQPGSLYLAQTEAREPQLRLQAAKARYYGMAFHEVTRDEAERLHPLVDFDGIRCIMYEPQGGNVDPSGVTMAYAAGARARGAQIHRNCPATATRAQPDGSWIVETPLGTIHTQWVVNAAGLW